MANKQTRTFKSKSVPVLGTSIMTAECTIVEENSNWVYPEEKELTITKNSENLIVLQGVGYEIVLNTMDRTFFFNDTPGG